MGLRSRSQALEHVRPGVSCLVLSCRKSMMGDVCAGLPLSAKGAENLGPLGSGGFLCCLHPKASRAARRVCHQLLLLFVFVFMYLPGGVFSRQVSLCSSGWGAGGGACGVTTVRCAALTPCLSGFDTETKSATMPVLPTCEPVLLEHAHCADVATISVRAFSHLPRQEQLCPPSAGGQRSVPLPRWIRTLRRREPCVVFHVWLL